MQYYHRSAWYWRVYPGSAVAGSSQHHHSCPQDRRNIRGQDLPRQGCELVVQSAENILSSGHNCQTQIIKKLQYWGNTSFSQWWSWNSGFQAFVVCQNYSPPPGYTPTMLNPLLDHKVADDNHYFIHCCGISVHRLQWVGGHQQSDRPVPSVWWLVSIWQRQNLQSGSRLPVSSSHPGPHQPSLSTGTIKWNYFLNISLIHQGLGHEKRY